MFKNSIKKIKWLSIINSPFTPPYMRDIIYNILIPYGIDPNTYTTNQECINNCCKKTKSALASPSIIQIVSDLNYKFSCIRCSSMPMWYYYAFPDVFLWSISDDPQTKNILNRLSKYESELLNERNEVKTEYVKMFIDAYLNTTKKELECTKSWQ